AAPGKPGAVVSCWPSISSGDRHRPSPRLPPSPNEEHPIGAHEKEGALVTAAAAPPLAPDLAAGLRRLKLAAMRQLAPELLVTAKTQRWAPEELLRTLVEAEITARDASNARTRMKQAAFPVTKTLEDFDRSASSVPAPTLYYLTCLEWIRAAENLCLAGLPGTGKSHLLVGFGDSSVKDWHNVRLQYCDALD